jgi:hypothetical protein
MVWFSYKQDTMYLPSNLIAKLDATVKRLELLEIDLSKVKRLLLGEDFCSNVQPRVKYCTSGSAKYWLVRKARALYSCVGGSWPPSGSYTC